MKKINVIIEDLDRFFEKSKDEFSKKRLDIIKALKHKGNLYK